MSNISQAEKYLLEQIRRGDGQAWSQLVNRYQGRLLHFARTKLAQRADCEDIVQDTFISFIKSLYNYQRNCSLETYLFVILRRKIIDTYRRKKSRDVGLIQDIYKTTSYKQRNDAFENLPAPQHTGSWYVRRNEQYNLKLSALSQALAALVNSFKRSSNFRDLKIVELVFYCHLSNSEIAETMNISEKKVALIKHRCLKQVREHITKLNVPIEPSFNNVENILNEVWELQRFSCPKRSTIGAYLLETLDRNWHCYVDFHLNVVGCQFCQANLKDIQHQTVESKKSDLHIRIMESTVGFLNKP